MTTQQVKQRYGIIGNSREINTAVEIATQVAPTDVTVLIVGENGVGKDIFPRIIHEFSKRRHKRFIAVNTGSIPEGTLNSELFGHEKGSFTSAYDSRKGYFEEVDEGTIFLDEVGEMPTYTQVSLLRLLESGEYLRVGSSKVQKTDVRVIAATNRNLMEMIRSAKFREDLYFRLNTVTITVPPLRDRGDDIELLFNFFALHFAEKYHRDPIILEEEAIPLLYKYRWPGNIRELRNLVEKLTVLVKGEFVSANVLQRNLLVQDSYLPSVVHLPGNVREEELHDLNDSDRDMLLKVMFDLRKMGKEVSDLKKMFAYVMRDGGRGAAPDFNFSDLDESDFSDDGREAAIQQPEILTTIQPTRAIPPLLEESLDLGKKEKEMIIKALNKHSNNRKKAAQELGISERTLYRKIKNYDIER
ncbi:MAG: sigma-54 dependent transcriptional regulator [Bacteroidota bacterium]